MERFVLFFGKKTIRNAQSEFVVSEQGLVFLKMCRVSTHDL